ncbi:MAG: hypothetical protein JNM10_03770 [Planctomycetia bacterium]|nr:hypothetical protein [Planctomycetia bacterium]
MARPRNNAKHLATAAEDLVRALTRFVNLAGDAMQDSRGGRGTERGNAVRPGTKPGRKGTSPGRLRQIEAMKAYWAKRRAEKAAKVEK